jgi:hypothetical protein
MTRLRKGVENVNENSEYDTKANLIPPITTD